MSRKSELEISDALYEGRKTLSEDSDVGFVCSIIDAEEALERAYHDRAWARFKVMGLSAVLIVVSVLFIHQLLSA